ncbi:hypothetical protein PBY51_017565 [Eleginops maclovinus]|uniref:Rho guanine nucleotide exchange factor 5 n=1 Tax=Eleginops maclovinus TaxID=56733 RepID=A0AAN8AP41_ELEMC|nr:hypothetical protein PBY51_017565 [Eleginops maclovinus]
MGTKRPSCTLFDTLTNINTSERKLQPGGRISQDPSPRPAMTAQSERERDSNREEDRRREREAEKMRDKTRYKSMDPWDRYSERDRAPAPRPREGEKERTERVRRQEDDRRRNGRPLSSVEKESLRELERGTKKGDTFPRIRKSSPDRGRGIAPTRELDKEREERRQRDGPRREPDDWERERDRTWQRERYREKERDEIRSRGKEEGTNRTVGRPIEDDRSRKMERYLEPDAVFQDRRREGDNSRDRRERDAARKREKLEPNKGGREVRVPSAHGRREREMYSDRGEGRRDTRSEGDSDEIERKRERVRIKHRQELTYHHSKSEGDNKGKTQRDKDRDKQGYRDEDRNRYRDREAYRTRRKGGEKDTERYREADRRVDREGDRGKESVRDLKDDRREEDRYRDRGRETKEREADPSRDDMTGSRSISQNETAPRVPPRAQSSGEWSSDMDSDIRYRRGRDKDSFEESGKESDRDAEDQRNPGAERNQSRQTRSEGQERDRGEMTGQRRMWLEPQRDKNRKDELVDRQRGKERRRYEDGSLESQAEWEREGRRVTEEPYDKYLPESSNRGRREGRNRSKGDTGSEGVSVDGEDMSEVWRERDEGGMSNNDRGKEGRQRRDAEGESVTLNTEESDREEDGGRHYRAQKDYETGWSGERDRVQSGEDGFVTLSSGGDDEDEREEDEEEEFEDCREFLESSHDGIKLREGEEKRGLTMGKEEGVDEEEEKKPKYVFCVIGQTLPRSDTSKMSPSQDDHMGGQERHNPNMESCDEATQDDGLRPIRNYEKPVINNQEANRKSECDMPGKERPASEDTNEVNVRYREAGGETRSKGEHPYAEIGAIRRESQTEKLLQEWRNKNKEGVEEEQELDLQLPSNPYSEVGSQVNFKQIQPILDGINTEAMSPEEVEAIRIRMSGAWSMSEEPKRHSQAPHLKWAKNVLWEILGHSEEHIIDEANLGQPGVNQLETANKNMKQHEEVVQGTVRVPVLQLSKEQHSEPELEEEEPVGVEELRGMMQGQADMHADQFTSMHGDTTAYTHDDTVLDAEGKVDLSMDIVTEPSDHIQSEKAAVEVIISKETGDNVIPCDMERTSRDKEVEMYLTVSNTLYKPNSCPILNYDSESDLLDLSREGEDRMGEKRESEEERQGEDLEESATVEEVGEETEGDSEKGEVVAEPTKVGGTVLSSCSFRDLGPEARMRRRGIRKTTERRNEENGRDRRTRIFSTTDDEDDRSKSWGEVELRNVLDTIDRRKRNSKFFNAAQLYQQYNEAAQNIEILRQAGSNVISVCEDIPRSPVPSPPPARRPLPPIPPVPHPHSLSHSNSITSVKSLPLPEPPKHEGRPSSPRLSISLTQSASLWRELPGVRNSVELVELTDDQRRLQEVRFEVVTSEASYCRSLDIVVEHFVKSKQLGALLASQDRNWLFSRLADVRAISHSFLAKLEERVESDTFHFTVCDIIAWHCQRFKLVYVPYLTNQSYQDATYQRLMEENPGFRRIVEKLERSPVCQRLPLRSFLVLPFQRIIRIRLLVQNIVKRTTPGTAEATQAIKALKLLEKLIQESNDSITQMKSIESLVSLSAKVGFECRTLPLISQSRRMVREGLVTELMDFSLKDTERNIYLHLFNDYLLISLQKEGGRFTVIDHSPVSDLRAENCRVKLHTLQKNLFRLHMTNRALLLRTDKESDKLRWISALSRPHPEIDFSAAEDFTQMQCIRAIVGHQPDELSLEKADIILVHQQSSDHWVEGTRLSDRHRGWVPDSHLETITNSKVRQRNLSDAIKLTTATAEV